MACYSTTRLALDAFPTWKILPNALRIYQDGSLISASNPAKFSGFSPYCSSVAQRLGLGFQISANRIRCNALPLRGCAKRFYDVVYRFNPRKPCDLRRWFKNLCVVLTVVLVGFCVYITVFFGHLETVPFTKRKHFVLSESVARKIAEAGFQMRKGESNWKILPATHPESVRVRLISENIIEALQRWLKKEQEWTDLKYDKWIQQSRKIGQGRGSRAQTSHLEGLKWEVLVVDDPVVNAFCTPEGKIVVFTGLLNHLKTDAEIATTIGHEVGHTVARHIAENLTKNLWFAILQLILYQFVTPDFVDLVNTMSSLLLKLPFSRKMEIEADYIGLLLMASAGYDPRVAPKVFENMGKLMHDWILDDYISTHPSGKKRAQLLARAKVMDEAVALYSERVPRSLQRK